MKIFNAIAKLYDEFKFSSICWWWWRWRLSYDNDAMRKAGRPACGIGDHVEEVNVMWRMVALNYGRCQICKLTLNGNGGVCVYSNERECMPPED